VGGILYDHGGKTVTRYHWNLGMDTNNKVEAYTLLKGVQLAHSKGIRKLVVLGDSLTIIRLMVKGSDPKDPSLKQILDRTRLASKGIKLSFFHILRGNNNEADKLANAAIGTPPGHSQHRRSFNPNHLILMSVQEHFLARQRSPSSWGLSFPHNHMVRTNASFTQVWRKGRVHTHFRRGPICKERHDMAGWTLSVVHMTTCHRTIWPVPYEIHLPRAYKMISPPSTVKSSSRMGKTMYPARLCGFNDHDFHPPRRFISPDVSHPSMASVSTLHKTLPTYSQARSSPSPSANPQPSFRCVWPSWEILPFVCLSRSPWLLFQPPRHPSVIPHHPTVFPVFFSEPLVSSGAVNFLFAVLGLFFLHYPCPSLRSLLGNLSVTPP
jgi:ribonuclease HI